MEKYLSQLLADIADATANVSFPFIQKQFALHEWIAPDEEDKYAPVRQLEEWTGISKEQLPPARMLSAAQVTNLLEALKKMLDAHNCSFVMQIAVPNDIQYAAIRENFNQQVKVKRWHMGFFEPCQPNTKHGECALGEYCQCAFYAELFSNFIDEDLTPEEERARTLENEIQYLKRKYEDDWMKYYPYHLDRNFDDKEGNAYNYGLDDEDGDEDW